jgi:hypothetical protein
VPEASENAPSRRNTTAGILKEDDDCLDVPRRLIEGEDVHHVKKECRQC